MVRNKKSFTNQTHTLIESHGVQRRMRYTLIHLKSKISQVVLTVERIMLFGYLYRNCHCLNYFNIARGYFKIYNNVCDVLNHKYTKCIGICKFPKVFHRLKNFTTSPFEKVDKGKTRS